MNRCQSCLCLLCLLEEGALVTAREEAEERIDFPPCEVCAMPSPFPAPAERPLCFQSQGSWRPCLYVQLKWKPGLNWELVPCH